MDITDDTIVLIKQNVMESLTRVAKADPAKSPTFIFMKMVRDVIEMNLADPEDLVGAPCEPGMPGPSPRRVANDIASTATLNLRALGLEVGDHEDFLNEAAVLAAGIVLQTWRAYRDEFGYDATLEILRNNGVGMS